ncbi:ATPase [Corynebacterium liangguodongii]|uniref:ATPase n=1 Tax=Corynebacterium liangguodongii TaxID=2079535 RepID=A0A2S0WHH3_9CORY|nr:ATPase [Corynebacterium liangguodongii]PWB99425.1 ATPase [Corynebacterium liangguodongii]
MFIDQARLAEEPTGYLADLPAVRSLARSPLRLTAPVTIFTGGNGAGKSTLVEALAVASHANPEGGSRNARFETAPLSVSSLWRSLTLTRSHNPRDVFFLRGETYAALADYYESITDPQLGSLHQLSHGEGLRRLIGRRFSPACLLFLDEPEDGLSSFAQLELLGTLWHLADAGAQVIMATHSPILAGIPGAQLLHVDDDGIRPVAFADCDPVEGFSEFISDPAGTVRYLTAP